MVDSFHGMSRQRAFTIMADVVDELMHGIKTLDEVRTTLRTVELCVVAMTILLYTIVFLALLVALAYAFARRHRGSHNTGSANLLYAHTNATPHYAPPPQIATSLDQPDTKSERQTLITEAGGPTMDQKEAPVIQPSPPSNLMNKSDANGGFKFNSIQTPPDVTTSPTKDDLQLQQYQHTLPHIQTGPGSISLEGNDDEQNCMLPPKNQDAPLIGTDSPTSTMPLRGVSTHGVVAPPGIDDDVVDGSSDELELLTKTSPSNINPNSNNYSNNLSGGNTYANINYNRNMNTTGVQPPPTNIFTTSNSDYLGYNKVTPISVNTMVRTDYRGGSGYHGPRGDRGTELGTFVGSRAPEVGFADQEDCDDDDDDGGVEDVDAILRNIDCKDDTKSNRQIVMREDVV